VIRLPCGAGRYTAPRHESSTSGAWSDECPEDPQWADLALILQGVGRAKRPR